MKKFVVNINMTWSEDVKVTAKTASEARKKAWAKFAKRVPKKNFTFLVDRIDL